MQEELYLIWIQKKLDGSITEAESAQLDAWLQASPDNRAEFEAAREAWELAGELGTEPEVDLDAEFAALEARIEADEKAEKAGKPADEEMQEEPVKTLRLPWRGLIAAAACLAILLIISKYGLPFQHHEIEWAEFRTGYEVKAIGLPDGSKVTLNEYSMLRYAVNMEEVGREVELIGQGFFEVEKDPDHTFTVNTMGGDITVLGTKFEVNTDKMKQETRVMVREGKVRFDPLNYSGAVELNPGEGASFSWQDQKLNRLQAEVNEFAWVTGELDFSDVPLSDIVAQIEELGWFKVHFENDELGNCPFTGKVYRRNPLFFIENLATVFGAEFMEERGEYVIKGGSCQ